MKIKLIFILMVLILIGCVEDATITPTQEALYLCPGTPDIAFEVLNDNPCLEGAMRTEGVGGIEQWKPERHTIISIPETIEGYENDLSGHAEIVYNNGYVFNLFLINGEWGFELPAMIISEGCVGFKMVVDVDVENDAQGDLVAGAFISLPTSNERLMVGSSVMNYNGDFEYYWSLQLNSSQILTPSFTVRAGWGGSKYGSNLVIKSLFVVKSPSGYCNGDILELG